MSQCYLSHIRVTWESFSKSRFSDLPVWKIMESEMMMNIQDSNWVPGHNLRDAKLKRMEKPKHNELPCCLRKEYIKKKKKELSTQHL